MRTLTTPLAALALVIAAATPAFAQTRERPIKEAWAKTQGDRFGLEFDLLSRGTKLEAGSPKPDTSLLGLGFTGVAQVKLFGGLHLDAEIPFAYGRSSPSGTAPAGEPQPKKVSGFVLGNPTLGLHYSGNLTPAVTLYGGLGASIPVIHPSDSTAAAAAITLPARADFDMHRLMLRYVGLRARVGTELRFLGFIYVRSDVSPLLLLPTGDGGRKFVLEQGNELELRAPFGFGGGLRFQEAFTLSESDLIQTAMEPFIGYEPAGTGMYVRAGLLIALDKDLGFGLDQGKVATARLAIGGKY